MDDNNFDDLLKGKLKNYEDPTFDPPALDGLHERISNFQPSPWYAGQGLRIAFVSSLFFLTGINTYFFIHNFKLEKNTDNTLLQRKLYSNTIDSLTTVIDQLQCQAAEQKTDVRQPVILASPKFQLHLLKEDEPSDLSSVDLTYKVGLGSKENIPFAVYNKLKEEGLLADENGEVFLLLPKRANPTTQHSFHTRLSDFLLPIPQPGTLQLISTNIERPDKKKSIHAIPEGKTSLSARNFLEKHYFNKLGIQIAPHVDLVKGIFSQGSGGVTPRVGLTADWLVSPRLSIESSIDYTTTQNQLNHTEISPYAQYNPQLGSCEKAILTNRLLSVPLSVKYRQWISDKSQLILRAGYTPYGILAKQYQYNYVRPDIKTTDMDLTTTLYNQHDIKFYGSTVSTSAGFTIKRNKNKGTWETSLYYEHSLGHGFDQKPLQLVGLRTAYWFKVSK